MKRDCKNMFKDAKNRGPLTPEQRVDMLFDANEFPTYMEIVSVIEDAEFDALNFPETIAVRHGQ